MSGRRQVVAIVGGGAAGTLTAIHIAASAPTPVHSFIVEPRPSIGRGVAYGTVEARHLLNVPAERLSAFSHQPQHFAAWARRHHPSDGDPYLPRAWYGEYLSALATGIEHIQDRVIDVLPSHLGVQLRLEQGRTIDADRAVLALGSSPPEWPTPLSSLSCCPSAIKDPWTPGALDAVRPRSPAVLIGSGLTAIDVALTLRARGNREIVAVSRHGLLPAAHLDNCSPATLTPPPVSSARALIRWYRWAVAEHPEWRAVVDGLRPHTDDVWAALSEAERSRLLRLTFRRWEVARHRMAPRVAASIEEMRESGDLTVRRGTVRGWRPDPAGGVEVLVDDGVIRSGSIVNCTGPGRDIRQSADPLIKRILSRGTVRPGPLNLGLDVTPDGEVPGSGGRLWVVGPLRRGHAWETTAIPEIRAQAEAVCRSWWPARSPRARGTEVATLRATGS